MSSDDAHQKGLNISLLVSKGKYLIILLATCLKLTVRRKVMTQFKVETQVSRRGSG